MRDQTLCGINIGLALLVITFTGCVLYLTSSTNPAQLDSYLTGSIVQIGVALLFALSGILALCIRTIRRPVLTAHALTFGVVSLLLLLRALWILCGGYPKERVSWSPGILTAICFYSAYLFRQVLLLPRLPENKAVKYFHWYAAGLAGVIDLGVFIKLLLKFMQLWRGEVH